MAGFAEVRFKGTRKGYYNDPGLQLAPGQKLFAQQAEVGGIRVKRHAQNKPGGDHQSCDGGKAEKALGKQTLERDPRGGPDLESEGGEAGEEVHRG